MDLDGKKALVTGGAHGIGRCCVEVLLEHGVSVAILDVDKPALASLGAEMPDLVCLPCDIGEPEQVADAVSLAWERLGGIDICVNCAAKVANSLLVSFGMSGIVKHDIGLWNEIIQCSLNGTFYTAVHVAEKMMQHRTKGVIVNISSVCAAGNAGQSAYSAAKAGINAMTVAWAKELSLMGIRVAAVAPGYAKTETTLASVGEMVLEGIVKQTPARRLATPEEIVDAIVFVLKNDYITGTVLDVTGGLRI